MSANIFGDIIVLIAALFGFWILFMVIWLCEWWNPPQEEKQEGGIVEIPAGGGAGCGGGCGGGG